MESSSSTAVAAPARVPIAIRIVGTIGAWFILRLCMIFGRTHARATVPWLQGPFGGARIGDAPYREVAAAENLTVERRTSDGGLIPQMSALARAGFDPGSLHPQVRDFYEHTARYAMDVWSETSFPTRIGLWLLVKTISRQVNQLNFPLTPLETAHGMSSEILLLRRADGSIRYTGWFRTLGDATQVLYTGFYMSERPPNEAGACVKVVFPMPRGNATVLLRPSAEPGGALILDSSGKQFGDAGFYRLVASGKDRVRVWHIKTLKEKFRVYVDERNVLRCDHLVTFWGMTCLRLHYKIFKQNQDQNL